ncbi:HAMP domain-containing histidine kinase [Devosia sp. PTR5]|uniref:histidine kinase n=1 Tax=Devosia oryzisoli TaxID=2774138 RepID=A0A927IQJ5_9HYPH|nr:HAMP domain-containing sensor histidine kinase [Devosia oryzisoli]MBD8065700.1 HAMP domain-containing histidine kinase [Devosia oryzisoli]
MTLPSLKLRLMGLAAIWVIVSLLAAAFILHFLFVANLERTAHEDMDAAMTRLVALIDAQSPGSNLTAPLPDPRYDTPLGGRYWQITTPDGAILGRSRSLWDMTIPVTGATEREINHFAAPPEWHIIYIMRSIDIGGRTIAVMVGEDHQPIHAAANKFAWDIGWLFSLLALLILLAAWLQLRLGLAPLARLREGVDAVRKGQKPRLIGEMPREVLPLIDEVNALLEERAANTEKARRRASDLAHGLKTPLAALHGIALRVRDKGNAADADLIDDLAFEMSKRVDYQMRVAALQVRNAEHRESTSLNSAVIRTITVLKKTGRGEGLHWMADLPQDFEVDIHRQDLMELVGVLLENATKWAASQVIVRSHGTEEAVQLEIGDDGVGIEEDKLAALGRRGVRLDETAPGTGLGLSIAAEILDINGGTIDYGRSEAGGLRVTVTLPLTNR